MFISKCETADAIFEGRDQGHISTIQIQRLLNEAAEKTVLQETGSSKLGTEKGLHRTYGCMVSAISH